jgi:hypothetical protein
MPFHDLCFFLRRELVEYLAQCLRSSRYSVFLLHFGMKTTWYLQCHTVWLRL